MSRCNGIRWNSVIVCGMLCSFCLLPPLVASSQTKKPNRQEKAAPSRNIRSIDDWIEAKLARWNPTNDNAELSDKTLLSPQTEIVGIWKARPGFEGSTLVIKRSGKDTYKVEFSTGGCLSEWSLKRTGHYADGVLMLDRPVKEYAPRTYRRLYVIKVGGKECLVPDAAVVEFVKGLSADKKSLARIAEMMDAFSKNPPSLVEELKRLNKLSQ